MAFAYLLHREGGVKRPHLKSIMDATTLATVYEPCQAELLRTPYSGSSQKPHLLGTLVNKGKKKGRSASGPDPSCRSNLVALGKTVALREVLSRARGEYRLPSIRVGALKDCTTRERGCYAHRRHHPHQGYHHQQHHDAHLHAQVSSR